MVESIVGAKKSADGGDDGSMFTNDAAGIRGGHRHVDGGGGVIDD